MSVDAKYHGRIKLVYAQLSSLRLFLECSPNTGNTTNILLLQLIQISADGPNVVHDIIDVFLHILLRLPGCKHTLMLASRLASWPRSGLSWD